VKSTGDTHSFTLFPIRNRRHNLAGLSITRWLRQTPQHIHINAQLHEAKLLGERPQNPYLKTKRRKNKTCPSPRCTSYFLQSTLSVFSEVGSHRCIWSDIKPMSAQLVRTAAKAVNSMTQYLYGKLWQLLKELHLIISFQYSFFFKKKKKTFDYNRLDWSWHNQTFFPFLP
jgi:hypothetical protein